jgi:hypothetical protein
MYDFMAARLILFLLTSCILSAAPALAQSPISPAEKYSICQALRLANQDGISGRYMLEEMLARRGEPKYLAKVIMNDVKPVCPKVY